MIYRAIQLIQIFLADEQTDEGVPRGPRGPKKDDRRRDDGTLRRVTASASDLKKKMKQLANKKIKIVNFNTKITSCLEKN